MQLQAFIHLCQPIQTYNVSCFGASDGSATSTPFGGTTSTGTYSYQWSIGSQTTQSINNLIANVSYIVTVTDDNGCIAIDSVTLTEPTQLTGSFTNVSDESCPENNDGSITAIATSGSGVGPYLYDFGLGQTTNNTSSNLAGSLAGVNYAVTITDTNGCSIVIDTFVYEPDTLLITNIGVTSDYNGFGVSCFGASDGAAIVQATGGTLGYQYDWDPALDTSSTLTGLSSGFYYVTVIDANGCEDSASLFVSEPAALTISTNVDSATCNGFSDGTIAVQGAGASGLYTYAIDTTGSGPSAFGLDSLFTGLAAGTYEVFVQDSNGCGPVSTIVTLYDQAPISWSASVASPYNGQQQPCYGDSLGTATIVATGGSIGNNFIYQWDTNAASQTTQTATNLHAATYQVTITDTVSNCIEMQLMLRSVNLT